MTDQNAPRVDPRDTTPDFVPPYRLSDLDPTDVITADESDD